MTTCRDSIELLLAYVEGDLPSDERHRLEEHFSDCQPCEDFLATYQKTPGVCRDALAKAIPDEVARRLGSFLRGEIARGCACTAGDVKKS